MDVANKIRYQRQNCEAVLDSFSWSRRDKTEGFTKGDPDRSTALALNSFSWSEGQGAARVKPAIKSTV
jgi:hypothetical protein